jgi:hypothetical protein
MDLLPLKTEKVRMDLLPLKTTPWFALHIFPQSHNKIKVQTYEVSADSLKDREITYGDKVGGGGGGGKKKFFGVIFLEGGCFLKTGCNFP